MTWSEGYRHFLQHVQGLYDPSEADVITSLLFEKFASVNKKDIIRDGKNPMPDEILYKIGRAHV